jgi:hypothetical protein
MEERTHRRAAAILASQDGLARTDQLLGVGVSAWTISRRVDSGEWVRPARGIVGVPSPDSWRRRVRIALLAAGEHSAASHATAARVHGFDGYARDDRLVLTGVAGRRIRSVAGVEVRRCDLLLPLQRRLVDGLTTVIRPVALMQIAAIDGRDAAAKALDGMLRDGDRPTWIRSTADAWRGRGVSGPMLVLDLLHERVEARLPLSWFQRLAKRCLVECGISTVDEHPVYDADGTRLATLDLAIPELRIGVECQSWEWHGSPAAKTRDVRRKRRLRMVGWEIVEVWWTDLERMDAVAAEVGVLVDQRRSTRPFS